MGVVLPEIDFLCRTCEKPFVLYRSVHSTACPPCPTCGSGTERYWIAATDNPSQAAPVVVYKAPDGSFRFPGSPDGASAKNYDKLGYTRIEARGYADVRRLEHSMNEMERSKIARRVERQQAHQEAGERIRRSDFHHGLHHGLRVPTTDPRTGERVMKTVQMGARSRDIARILMSRNNAKGVRTHEPGFHVEAYSYDRSNREASRDEQGRRRRD